MTINRLKKDDPEESNRLFLPPLMCVHKYCYLSIKYFDLLLNVVEIKQNIDFCSSVNAQYVTYYCIK